MRTLTITTVLMLAVINGICQVKDNAKMQTAIVSDAKKMADLLLKKDYDKYVTYMNPVVFALEKTTQKGMADKMRKQMEMLAQHKVFISALAFGTPSRIIDTANTLQCVLPEHMTMLTAKGKTQNHNSLLAMSRNGGKNWVFVEISPETRAQIKAALPPLSSKHVIVANKVDFPK